MSKFKTNTLAFSIQALIGLSAFQVDLVQADLIQAKPTKTPIMREQPHAVYHRVQHQTLKAAMESIAHRTGIVFNIHPSLEADLMDKKLAADNWNAAIEQLLEGYNHVVQTKAGQVALVTVTGRHHNGQNSQAVAPVVAKDLIAIEPKLIQLPEKYKRLEKGSVQAINIPAELIHTPLGQTFELDLPNGRYTVTHDNQIKHGDNQTWMGHLDEGLGYRVSLSQGKAGTMGTVMTPDGEYMIETTQGQTVWVDLNRSGMKDGGFEGDTGQNDHHFGEVAASQALIDEGVLTFTENEAPTAELTRSKNAAEAARSAAEAAARKVTDLNSQIATANQSLQAAPAAIAAAKANLSSAQAALKIAKKASAKSPKDINLKNQVKVAANDVKTADKKRLAALKAPKAIKAKIKTLSTALVGAQKQLTQAKAEAEQKEARYQFDLNSMVNGAAKKYPGMNKPEIPFEGSGEAFNPDTTIDVLVVYTTKGQTQDYAKQRIQYLVDISNQANQDSGVNMQYRLVHTEAINYPETTGNDVARQDMVNGAGGAAILALRDQYGADVTVLFRPLHIQTSKNCGYAFVGGPAADEDIEYVVNETYATVSDGIDMDGVYSFCHVHAFAHEIGHLLGNEHEVENSDGSEGRFSYSYAWGVKGHFGTIMSYVKPGIMLFSGANLTTECLGQPCGYPEGNANASDQVRTMNQTAPFMARLRDSITVTPSIE